MLKLMGKKYLQVYAQTFYLSKPVVKIEHYLYVSIGAPLGMTSD